MKVQRHLIELKWSISLLKIAFSFYNYLSISGGKDSLVLLHIATTISKKIRAYMFHNEREDDEVCLLTWKISDQVIQLCPYPGFEQCVKILGEPQRWRRWCTTEMKVKPAKRIPTDIVITGARSEESYNRKKRGYYHFWKGQVFINPLYFWSTFDIWFYSGYHQILHWRGYRQGEKRMGCIPCPFEPTRHSPDLES